MPAGALTVRLDGDDLTLQPGGSVSGRVVVRNGADRAARARLRMTGPAAPWAFVVPPEVTLGPGEQTEARFGFRAPRGPEPAAGPLAFRLGVQAVDGADEAAVDGVLRVLPFDDVALVLGPAQPADDGSVRYQVTVANRGNGPARAALTVSGEGGLAVETDRSAVVVAPGERETGTVVVRSRSPAGRSRPALAFVVAATPEGGQPVVVEGRLDAVGARRRPFPAVAAALVAVVLAAVLLRFTVLAPADDEPAASSSAVPARGATTPDPACPATGHVDLRVTGLTPAQIPLLPADYSFFNLRDDGCAPIRWNPCEPIHFVVNPALAPPTGLADVREAFARMGTATGLTFVDDGLSDEPGARRRPRYQPERYGERWAPILVYWQTGAQRTEDILIVGGGFPSRQGDVYVTGGLFLNVDAVTNPTTREPLQGGFGPDPEGLGPIGPAGVTWGRVILHELGHMMGLSHVRDPAQLMYPETTEHTTRPTMFAPGDLAGLRQVGIEAGCLTTPPPTAEPTGGGGRR